MKKKLDRRKKQILSWPFLTVGMYSLLHAFSSNSSDKLALIGVFIFLPGVYLRDDLLGKRNLQEFDMKYKVYNVVGAVISSILSVAFLAFVLINLETINIHEYNKHIAMGFGVALVYFGLPCEMWLFKKYRNL